jgi:hypothetical protein
LYLKEEFYICPNNNCKRKIQKEWIIENIGSDNMNRLSDILLQKYITTSSDVQKCPKENCNYAGIYNNDCTDYECDACYFKWSNKVEYNFLSSIYKKDYFKEFMLNDLSDFHIKFFSRPCYHCGKYVSKTNGCDHITCVCKGEFCYLCLSNWNDHKQLDCYMKRDVMFLTIFFLIFIFVLKIVFSFDIICYGLKNLVWLIGINLLVALIVAITWFLTYVVVRLKKMIYALIFMGVEILILYMYYVYCYEDFIQKLKIIGLELIVIIAAVVIGGLLFLLKYFFKR